MSRFTWLALLCCFAFVACSDENDPPDSTPDPDLSEVEPEPDQPDILPDLEIDDEDLDTPDLETEVPDPDLEVDETDVEVDETDVEVDETETELDLELDEEDLPVQCGYGAIHGRVCSPNGSSWLSDVEVTVSGFDCDGNPIVIQDFTDAQGFYDLLNVPSGIHSIIIVTGSYTTSIPNVAVEPNKTTDLTGSTTKTCLDRRSAAIAVLTGTFDHIEQILDHLGIIYQLYEGDSAIHNPASARSGLDLLLDINALLAYDIIFINCGEWYATFYNKTPAEIQQMTFNLVTFVQSGGSIYVSDWAYFWAEMAFPDIIDYYGDDTQEGVAKVGIVYDALVANVVSDSFQRALDGAETITIQFNWPAWVLAESVSFSSTVHILAPTVQTFTSTLHDVPLVVSHKPTPTSGTVFFTSFHHEAQLTRQMEEVLRFLVFQL